MGRRKKRHATIGIRLIARRMVRGFLLLAAACWFVMVGILSARAAEGQGIMDCRQMEPGQFERLLDAQKIKCGGEEKTAGEIRRERQDKRELGQVQAHEARAEAQAKLQELRKEYGPEMPPREAEAKMRAELAKLKQPGADVDATRAQLGKIRQEAVRLQQAMQTARGLKEKAKIEAEAKELAEQLHALGGGGDLHEYLYAKICEITDCFALHWIPHIDGVLPFSVVSPNGPIIINGEHFGTVEGTLWLKGYFGNQEMTIDSWGDGGIGAFFPSAATIGTVSDLNLTLQVETSEGFKSNAYPLQWVQEVKLLDTGSVSVHNCGKDGNVNSCNWELYTGANCVPLSNMTNMILASKPPDPNCPCSAVGFHGNCWAAVGDDFGTDVYEISPLKNAWKLLFFSFADSLPEVDSCDDAVTPIGFQSGGNYWAPDIPWCVTPNDELRYWLWVYIVGPKGFAHQ